MSTSGRLITKLPAPLRELAFRRYWTAQTISYLGDQVTTIALPLIAVLALHAGAAEMGILTALEWLPALLFSLHAGALVDRRGRRRAMMIATDAGRALLLASVPVAYWAGALTLAQLFAVAFLTGSLSVLFNVSANGLFAFLVARERFVEGTALLRGSFSFSWIAGPSVGGLLVQLLSGPVALLADVASFCASALLLGSVRPAEAAALEQGGRVLDGLRFARRAPPLLAQLVSSAAINFFYCIYFSLLLLFAARVLDLSAGTIGVALGAGAVGALCGSFASGRIGRRIGLGPAVIAGAGAYFAALALVPLASPALAFPLLVAAEFVSGFGLIVHDICEGSIRQALTPDALRSRVMGAYLLLNNGSRPLGALAGGLLGAWIGLRATLWVAIAGGVASALLMLASRLARVRELPSEAVWDAAS